jgi:signal transduction histidine kinase
VLGFGEFVLHGLGKSHPQFSDVKAMAEAAAKVARLSQQLLAFSRQLPMVDQTVDLAEMIDRLVPALTAMLQDNHTLTVAGRANRPVKGDPDRLEQILVQLTSNARDAMPDGGQLTISTSDVQVSEAEGEEQADHDSVPGSYVLLSVTDTGIGMDPVTQSRAFEPFFTTKPFGRGTGLGLAMVHGIIKQHGGQHRLTSEPDRGTTFQVYLPAAVAEGPEEGESNVPARIESREHPGVEAHLAPEYH